MKRQLLCMLLVLAMLTTLAPVYIFAEGEPTAVTEETEVQAAPEPEPTAEPTPEPTQAPTPEPTKAPTPEPTAAPTEEPEQAPAAEPEKEAPAPVPEKKAEPENTASEPEPVRVEFRPVPDGAKLTVFTKDEKGNKEEIKPEKDGSFLLLPGRYFYTLEAEGFEATEEKELEVKASAKPVEVVPELVPIAEPAEEDEAVPASEAGEETSEPAPEEAEEPADEPEPAETEDESLEPNAEEAVSEEEGSAPETGSEEEVPENAEERVSAEDTEAEETGEGSEEVEGEESSTESADLLEDSEKSEETEEIEDGAEISNPEANDSSTTLIEGVPTTVNVNGDNYVYLFFTPQTSGVYTFSSESDGDPYGILCDINENVLAENDDWETYDFVINKELIGGTTYLLGVRWYSSDVSGPLSVTVIRNTEFGDFVLYCDGEPIWNNYLWTVAGKSKKIIVKSIDGTVINDAKWSVETYWSAQPNQPVISVTNGTVRVHCVGEAELTVSYNGTSQTVWFYPDFADVTDGDAYYYWPVYWAAENGITTGTSATTFSPAATCTRGQIVTFLWRAYGSPEPTLTANPFKDVKSDAFYYEAVLWAVENNITTGTSPTTFAPNSPCTRGHIVTFLWRAAGEPEPSLTTNPFKDVKSGAFYYKAVLWAVENGITTGTSATTFAPNSGCSRGQCVTFLWRSM